MTRQTTRHDSQPLAVNIKLRISQDLRDELAVLAQEGDRSVASEMRRGLRYWIRVNTPELRVQTPEAAASPTQEVAAASK